MNTETKTEKPTKKPAYVAYHVRDKNDESYWTRIGVAFAHQDGKGFNIQIETVPLDGRITLRVPTEKKE
jgi:hypothetical protein